MKGPNRHHFAYPAHEHLLSLGFAQNPTHPQINANLCRFGRSLVQLVDMMKRKTLFARGNPEEITFEETYTYRQVISQNDSTELSGTPQGRLTVKLPYDGEEWFGQKALKDVRRQMRPPVGHGWAWLTKLGGEERVASSSGQGECKQVRIGHLVVTQFDRTDLSTLFEPEEDYATLPLDIPVQYDGARSLDDLCRDRSAYTLDLKYRPQPPSKYPVVVSVDIFERKPVRSPKALFLAMKRSTGTSEAEPAPLQVEADRVMQGTTLNPSLVIRVQVRLDLEISLDSPPWVELVGLDWPTLTSLSGLQLTYDSEAKPVRYNPLRRRLEWRNVPLFETRPVEGSNVHRYVSPPMFLQVQHPGELFEQPELEGEARVKIESHLVSGVNVAAFDATGREQSRPKVASTLVNHFELLVDEAFARRVRTPRVCMHFGAMRPDLARVNDVREELEAQLFDVSPIEVLVANEMHTRHLILGRRQHGPDELYVFVVLDGMVRKEDVTGQGPVQIKSTVESGSLSIYMEGYVTGDSRDLLRELKTLQTSVRKRFEHVRMLSAMV